MKRIILFMWIALCLAGFIMGKGKESKWQISLLAGIDRVPVYGADSEYVPAENDFPVTPAHSPVCLGGSLVYFLNERAALELGGRYYSGTTVTLKDPSDQDTVDVNTAAHFSVIANFIFYAGKGNFRLYLTAGAGIDTIFAEDKTYTSAYGYEIEFLAPGKKVDFLINVGNGLQFYLSSNFGITLDARYIVIFDEPSNLKSLNLMAGVFFNL
ncbi:MAG: outer membrane beta-barrel protein [Candidatus Aminicenantes bacterium]|nr:outer membrane beta-barrel protein [Candidatus Aminicenantes bacterium]NIM80469.1 outer membrane beta-barrel protein [Candidatus Aminicenantes bacterium]NIN23908.1 outer membrane beta-barrel protein [Candidatus Aminicenantes bacterium]NIN47623.1 outer membrane beta-barrel protein [Candidatus Aminicenantes bacterium]NIN90553.1 outer membrane beta-barrel protein [Candidatus Aminicenantes bacterium]